MHKFILLFNFFRPALLMTLFYLTAFPGIQWQFLLGIVFLFALIDKVSPKTAAKKLSKKADMALMAVFIILLVIMISLNLQAGNYRLWHTVPFVLLAALTAGKIYMIFKPNAKLARFYS